MTQSLVGELQSPVRADADARKRRQDHPQRYPAGAGAAGEPSRHAAWPRAAARHLPQCAGAIDRHDARRIRDAEPFTQGLHAAAGAAGVAALGAGAAAPRYPGGGGHAAPGQRRGRRRRRRRASPSLTISGQYAQQTTRLNDFFTRPGAIWEAGAGLTHRCFTAGRSRRAQQEAEERYRQAQASYRSHRDRRLRRGRRRTASPAARRRQLPRPPRGARGGTRRPRSRARAVPRRQVHGATGADCRAAVPAGRPHPGAGRRSALHRHRGAFPGARRRLVERRQ